MKTTSLLLLCATALLAPAATTRDTDGTSAPALTSAEQIIKATRDGLCIAVMPSADTPLPLSNAPWRVMQVLLAGETNAAELAAAFRAAGTSGSITCRPLASDRLPYPNDFANAVVVGPGGSAGAAKTLVSEAWRVLAPEGVLLLDHPGGSNVDTLARSAGIAAPVVTMKDGMFAIRKPYPPEMDEWPQLEHDAARTRISHDKVVGIPTGFQWLHGEEGPYRNAQAMLAAGGRVFYAISESSTSFIIEARDAYNGVLAWSRRFTCRPAQARGRFMRPPPAKPAGFAADGERVYLTPEAGGAAVALSAATGSTIMTYATGGTLVLHDGLLVTHDPSSTQWNVIDPATGKQLRSLGTTNADPGSVMLCAGNNAYFLDNMSAGVTAAPPARTSGTAAPEPAVKNIVCADFHTGEVKWRAPAFNNGSLYWANRGLVALLRLNEDVTFFSADDGRYLWDTVSTTKKGNHAAAFYLGDRVWTYG
ncbi:PQQ-binding-like beta-propeller repeat protein, partial [bacterium]|nr:PQQ-binding-like beta-propeller repeat protein [bacterium]